MLDKKSKISSDPKIRRNSKVKLSSLFQGGMSAGEFITHYQPQIDFNSGRVVGLEVVAQWQPPERRSLLTDRSIEFSERLELAEDFTFLIIELALADLFKVIKKTDPPITISVNVPTEAIKAHDFTDKLLHCLQQHKFSQHLLRCEISELELSEYDKNMTYNMARMKMSGIQLSIDNFGISNSIGSNSTASVFSELKIHESLIQDVLTSERSHRTVISTIKYAEKLNLRIVALGVETPEVFKALQSMGCHIAQGFLLASPMTLSQFEAWFDRTHPLELS